MAFAIFYNSADLQIMATAFTYPGLDYSHYVLAKLIWDNGFSGWQTAQIAPEQYREGDFDTRIIVISYSGVTLQMMRDFFYWIYATYPGEDSGRLFALAEDLGGGSSHREPWPPV